MNDSSRSPFTIALLVAALAGAFLQIFVLWATEFPLGVPGEWEWPRIPDVIESIELIPLFAATALLTGYVFYFGRRVGGRNAARRCGLLIGLSLIGCGWVISLISAVPVVWGQARAPFVLYYERSSGYFWQAHYEVESVPEFLSTYAERIADSDKPENYLHQGTHPPGLTTAFVGLITLCERSPGLTDFLIDSLPPAVSESFAILQINEQQSGRIVRDSDVAAIWLACLLVGIAGVCACIPIYSLAARYVSSEAAWWIASLWLLVPVIAIFLPKSDVLFPFLAMLAQWQWLSGLDRNYWGWGAAAGLTMFLATWLSLAFVPVGLILVLQFLLVDSGPPTEPGTSWMRRRAWRMLITAAVCFLIPVVVLWVWQGLCLPVVWARNLTNHAAFYAHHARSYWPWLLETPLELAASLGLPLAVSSLAGFWLLCRPGIARRRELLIPAGVWTLLWLSGKNQGEAARLWIFLMPYALLLAAPAIERLLSANWKRRAILTLWCAQLAAAITTVLRVDGFHLEDLLRSQ